MQNSLFITYSLTLKQLLKIKKHPVRVFFYIYRLIKSYGLFSINPFFGLLIRHVFTNIVVMIPLVLMEDIHFSIVNWLSIFGTGKAVPLIFNLSSIKETTNTEESGLFCHYYFNLLNHLLMWGIKRFIGLDVKLSAIQ